MQPRPRRQHGREKPPYCAICRRRVRPDEDCAICDPPTVPEVPSRIPADATDHPDARAERNRERKEEHS